MSSQTKQSGEAKAHFHHREHHVLPLSVYYGVYGVLLVLTAATVGVSYANLGAASLFVAMFVAVVKAALVAGYFMHLKYDERFNSFVFFSSLLFLAIMFVLTMADLSSRGLVDPELDNFALRRDQAAQKKMDDAAAVAATQQAAPGAVVAPAGDAAAPAAPTDGAAPTGGAAPTDGATPTGGAAPTDGAAPAQPDVLPGPPGDGAAAPPEVMAPAVAAPDPAAPGPGDMQGANPGAQPAPADAEVAPASAAPASLAPTPSPNP